VTSYFTEIQSKLRSFDRQ